MADALRTWYPDVVVGAESYHLDEEYYHRSVQLLETEEERDTLALVLRHAEGIVGLVMLTKDERSRTVTSRMGALAPDHRRGAVGLLGIMLFDAAAKKLGASVVYTFVTLKSKHQQLIYERFGFQLVGIMPAWDIDMIEPNRPKRVFEAIYAKVLAPKSEWHIPQRDTMTARTRALWDFLFTPDDLQAMDTSQSR
ncbi:GNAT family N-acetyltransferase [Pendulispora albinea]|uniref:GNAT family N-acetyltransferase n=1 Tax=Pendulispora albinea TaxID=2741071 RepID=A0ABZ2LYB6_9BACT